MKEHISFDEFDEIRNPGPECTDFERISEIALSRRQVLGGGFKWGLAALALSTAGNSLFGGRLKANTSRMAFEGISANTFDTITVPNGYSWYPVISWGDPLWSNVDGFNHDTRGTAASQELTYGDNNDGMTFFEHQGRFIMAINNEYTNRSIIHGNRATKLPETDDDVRKNMVAHGVSIFEIALQNGRWSLVKDSVYNRRITPNTPMEITGPAAGHSMLKTAADPTGTRSLGTWNNCGNGYTPWGTYLACEENFNGYFSSSDDNHVPNDEMKRYGIGNKDWGYAWAKVDERFDISKHPNEVNRAGYIVEIDPTDPTSIPKKRTALGRFKHENAAVAVAANGHVVVYLGDDERGEFLYKFVSERKYAQGGENRNLLEDGTLFVAKFEDNQTGRWLPLTPESTGMTKAEISIHTRQAASKLGATTMDRPEWVAVNPNKVEAYCALTNNKNRAVKPNAGGDATPAFGPNPRPKNQYGQIVRWNPMNGDHTSVDFEWDLFIVVGNPKIHKDEYAGSENVTEENMFNSPDGLIIDETGLVWIQTDGNYSNEGEFAGMGNNQMLCADSVTGEIRRFLVGPNECEITGMTWSSDRRTIFVGVQHPGEKGNSSWPGGGNTVPRSTLIAINRQDGRQIV